MSFTTTNPWVQYAGDDNATEFGLDHKIHAQGDVVVLLTVDATGVTTTQTITTHYTVADVAEDAHDSTTPTITMLTPPATGETLTIYRQVDLIMDTSFLTTQFWQALSAEKQNELTIMAVQWLFLLVERCAQGSLASDPVTTTLEEILVAIGIIPISSLPAKTTGVDADVLRLGDSEDSGADKKFSLTNLWAYINTKVVALYALITSQAGAPSSTPAKVGNLNIDTTDDVPYIATDTASSADWKRLVMFAELINSSAGGADAGKPIKLDVGGKVDATMINSVDVDHDATTNFDIGKHRIINDSGTSSIELWSANKINAVTAAIIAGIVHRRAVINKVDNTAAPPTEVTNDRYILDETGGGVHADWDGASINDIVEFNGSTWDATSPSEGWMAYNDTDNINELFIDDGSPQWQPVAGGISDIVEDTTPQLGGDLDTNTHHLLFDSDKGIHVDAIGREVLIFQSISSATHYFTMKPGNNTTLHPTFSSNSGAFRVDSEIKLHTGRGIANGNGLNPTDRYLFFVSAGSSAVNYFNMTNALTTVAPILEVLGTDTDINLKISPKGAGYIENTGGVVSNRTATATDYTALKSDRIVGVTDTSIARTVTLGSSLAVDGFTITIKDESGAAGTNNITIDTAGAENIDGGASVAISTNYGSVTIYSDGTNFFTI